MSFRIKLLLYVHLLLSSLSLTANGQRPFPYIQQGPNDPRSIAFSPDSRMLVSGDSDGVRLYDLVTSREVWTLKHFSVKSVAFSPDGKIIATAGMDTNPMSNTGRVSYSIKLWSVEEGTLSRSLTSKSLYTKRSDAEISSIAFSPDGKLLASGCDDKTIRLWDVSTNSERIIKVPSSALSVVFSPDGKTLATGAYDDKARLWDVETWELLHTLDGHSSNVNTVSYSPDGTLLATASFDKSIKFWEPSSGKLLGQINGKEAVHSIAFSVNGKVIASASGLNVRLWDAATRTPISSPGKFTLNVNAVVFSPDGRMLASAVSNHRIIIWNTQTGNEIHSFTRSSDYVASLVLKSDDKTLISESAIQTKLWDYQSGELLSTIYGNTFYLTGGMGVLSPDRSLAAFKEFGGVSLFDIKKKQVLRAMTGHSLYTSSLSFRQDGKVLASGGFDGLVKVWNVATGKNLLTIDTNEKPKQLTVVPGLVVSDPASFFKNIVAHLSFSEDGRVLAGVANNGSANDKIRLWDTSDGRELRAIVGHSDFISAIAFDKQGKRLASGDDKGLIKIWDVETGNEICSLPGHTGRITSIVFDSRLNLLLSGAWDSQIKLWDLTSKQELLMLVSTSWKDWVAVTPDGLFDGTADAMQRVGWRIGNTSEVVPLESFYNDFFHPGLFYEIVEGQRPKANMDIASALQIPGFRVMLSQGLARIEKHDGKVALCFDAKPTAAPRVFSDAQPLAFDINSNNLISNAEDPACRYRIVLSGDKQYELINMSDGIKREVAKTNYEGVASETLQATLHVQTIAIGNYDFEKTGFKSLPSSVTGAKHLEELFAKQDNGPGQLYQTIRVWRGLYDSGATRQAIRERLDEMSKQVKRDDVVLLFLSGHGIVPAGQEMFYFATSDIMGPDPQTQRKTGLNTAMLAESIRSIPARRIVLIIDACQSGGTVESLAKVAEVKEKAELQRVSAGSSGASSSHERRVGIYVIAAATPLQQAVQTSAGESTLIKALFEALMQGGKATDGKVWIREVATYIQKRLPQLSAEAGQSHTPMIVSFGLDFPIWGKAPGIR